MSNDFLQSVIDGLSSDPKWLDSRYFYDDKGTELFRQIMGLEEYYLTDCELEILETRANDLADALGLDQNNCRHIVELGPGDGMKTAALLKQFLKRQLCFQYHPIDISAKAIDILQKRFEKEDLMQYTDSIVADFFQGIEKVSGIGDEPIVVFYMGSNLGNFKIEKIRDFLLELRKHLRPNDQLVIGVDLKKDAEVITAAYDDSKGVTAEFNLNLLDRINKELDGDLVRANFKHSPVYNEETGEMKSYLESIMHQEVKIEARSFSLSAGEKIHTETSKKFDKEELVNFANDTGFEQKIMLSDQRSFYGVVIWEAI